MNKKLIIAATFAVCAFAAFAHGGRNTAIAIEAIRGVAYALGGAPTVVAPAPTIVTTPVVTAPVVTAPVVTTPVVTTPVVTTTTIPTYGYGYYNNVYCPYYEGWYYSGNLWCWGGPGPRPPYPPAWRPLPYRPGPPIHHAPVFHGGHHGGPRGGFGGPRPMGGPFGRPGGHHGGPRGHR